MFTRQVLTITSVFLIATTWAALTNQVLTFPAVHPVSAVSILLGLCYYSGHIGQNTHQMPHNLRFCLRLKYVEKYSLDRKHEECYAKVALPLFENETIIEQPLDTWSLKDRYATAAVNQIFTARFVHHIYI